MIIEIINEDRHSPGLATLVATQQAEKQLDTPSLNYCSQLCSSHISLLYLHIYLCQATSFFYHLLGKNKEYSNSYIILDRTRHIYLPELLDVPPYFRP